MKLQFIKPSSPSPIYRSNVHRTGRIGFTIEAAAKFGININNGLALAINSEDPNDHNIYGILVPLEDENGYKIQKAGDYHSIKAAAFFDTLNIEYSKGDLSFMASEKTIEGQQVIIFTPNPRKPVKGKKENS